MAEVPEIYTHAAHCGARGCAQLDFLPFTCGRCEGQFCASHRTPGAHACAAGPLTSVEDRRVPVCPLCGQAVPLTAGDVTEALINDKVERHILEGCPSEGRVAAVRGASGASAGTPPARCALRGCKASLMVPVTCRQCGGKFCLAHRNELDHRCGGGGGRGGGRGGRGRGGAGAAALPAAMGPGAGGRGGRGASRSSTALRSAPAAAPPSNVWACPSCTLHNGLARAACEACGTRRPAGRPPPPPASSSADACVVT